MIEMLYGLLIAAAVLIAVAVVGSLVFRGESKSGRSVSPGDAAGIRGEIKAAEVIQSVLREDDRRFANIELIYQDQEAELDNVIVNRNGVFILEVKNYSGWLEGGAEDYEWTKYHVSDAGNLYEKHVKNPIRQVKRQVYILASWLESYGIRVWVSGYAFLLAGNSPVRNEYVLFSADDIDRAIHSPGRKSLNEKTIRAIERLLTKD